MNALFLVRAGKTSTKTLPGDWERNESIAASQTHATWGSPACREPHSFPRENLGNIGHIEKLEFRIDDVSDHRVRVLQHHQNLTSHEVKLEG